VIVSTYLIGVLFGAGIVISGMANPTKVLNFFDITGSFDPSLSLVMGGALVTTFFGYRFVLKRDMPYFADRFFIPTDRQIDWRLIGGSCLFGVGWGMAGFCPGGALPALGTGQIEVMIFVSALIVGILVARFTLRRSYRVSSNLTGHRT